MTSKITTAVRTLAATRPNFIYTQQPERLALDEEEQMVLGCSYVSAGLGIDGGQGCIIGQALVASGAVTFGDLAAEEDDQVGVGLISLYRGHPDWFEDTTRNEVEWMAVVQRGQDQGKTWAAAVADADEFCLIGQ